MQWPCDKDPPNRILARRFVDFVLSPQGQALWALNVGDKDGPVRRPLGRQPIRRDAYAVHKGQMLPWLVNPYQAGQAMQVTQQNARIDFGLLRELVYAAAMANRDALRDARQAIIRSGFDGRMVNEFNALPGNVSTLDKMSATAVEMKDPKKSDSITRDWRDFFRAKYARVVSRATQPGGS